RRNDPSGRGRQHGWGLRNFRRWPPGWLLMAKHLQRDLDDLQDDILALATLVEAVVTPVTRSPRRRMAPAPMKPMPARTPSGKRIRPSRTNEAGGRPARPSRRLTWSIRHPALGAVEPQECPGEDRQGEPQGDFRPANGYLHAPPSCGRAPLPFTAGTGAAPQP